jgi:hypothetical protein
MKMESTLQSAMENLTIARQYIDILLKMTPEQTRMRYCRPEFTADIKNTLKSCIGINIFIQSLSRQLLNDFDNKTISVEYKYHPRFGIVKIIDKASRSK